MDLIRTLGVAIDPKLAKSGGGEASRAFDGVGKSAEDMERKTGRAGKRLDETGQSMRRTSSAGAALRETLDRQNAILTRLERTVGILSVSIERQARATTTAASASAQAAGAADRQARSHRTAASAASQLSSDMRFVMRDTDGAARAADNAARAYVRLWRAMQQASRAHAALGAGGIGSGGAGVAVGGSALVPFQGGAIEPYIPFYSGGGGVGRAMRNVTPSRFNLDLSQPVSWLDRLRSAAAGARRGIGSIIEAAFSMRTALVATGLSLFVRDLINTERQAQATANALRYATGSEATGLVKTQYISDVSEGLGLNKMASARQYAQLLASGRGQIGDDELRNLFLATSKAATVLGSTVDETSGMLNAFSQMLSKGNVQAEELRGQLGERLYGAFQMAADGMGVTTQQLNKMLERGDVLAKDLIPAITQQMEKAFGEESVKSAQSLNSEINRLSNSWTDFKTTLFDTGVGNVLGDMLGSLKDMLRVMSELQGRFANWRENSSLPDWMMNPGRYSILGAVRTASGFLANRLKDPEQDARIKAALEPVTVARSYGYSGDPKAIEDMRRQGEALREELMTPMERYTAQMEHLRDLYGSAAISFTTFERAAAKAKSEYEEDAFGDQARKQIEAEEWKIEQSRRFREEIKRQADAVRTSLMTPTEQYSETVDHLGVLLSQRAITFDQYAKAIANASRELDRLEGLHVDAALTDFFASMDAKSTHGGSTGNPFADGMRVVQVEIEKGNEQLARMKTIGEGTANAIQDGFGSFTDSLVTDFDNIGKAFREMTAGILSDIAKIVLRQTVANPIAGALINGLGGAIGGSFLPTAPTATAGAGSMSFNSSVSAGTASFNGSFASYHTGGIVGQGGGLHKVVDPSIFIGAPRFHSGLRPDEFPAILQRGEEVVPKNEVGRREVAVSIPINVTVNGSDGGTSEQNQRFGKEIGKQLEAMVDMRIAHALRPQALSRRSGR